jgi:hypothetical protein
MGKTAWKSCDPAWHVPCSLDPVEHMRGGVDGARPSDNGGRSAVRGTADLSPAALFALVWNSLADLLGTAATATLLRRAAKRAVTREPALAELVIARESLEYRYTLPSSWKDGVGALEGPLRSLVGELLPLLVELTGPIAVRHLAQIPELRERGLVPPQEELT